MFFKNKKRRFKDNSTSAASPLPSGDALREEVIRLLPQDDKSSPRFRCEISQDTKGSPVVRLTLDLPAYEENFEITGLETRYLLTGPLAPIAAQTDFILDYLEDGKQLASISFRHEKGQCFRRSARGKDRFPLKGDGPPDTF